MAHKQSIARAVDIGFGFTKFSQSSIDENDCDIRAQVFPSYAAPAEGDASISGGALQRLHVVETTVDSVRYRVGPDAILAAPGRATRSETDAYFTSPQYMALYQGALAYMELPKGHDEIDMMGLALPTQIFRNVALRAAVERQACGEFLVPIPDSDGATRRIRVKKARAWPQVLAGMFAIALQDGDIDNVSVDSNLVIDAGYGTLLWLVTEGNKLQYARCGENMGGVSSMLKAVAKQLGEGLQNDPRTLDRIDKALRGETASIRVANKEHHVADFKARIDAQLHIHMQELTEKVGEARNIDGVFLAGGGGGLYLEQVKGSFPNHVVRFREGQFTNLLGIQYLAEQALLVPSID